MVTEVVGGRLAVTMASVHQRKLNLLRIFGRSVRNGNAGSPDAMRLVPNRTCADRRKDIPANTPRNGRRASFWI